MTNTIDFYFDFRSPYAYLAHTQLPGIAAEHGVTIAYYPFRVLELMRLTGNTPTTVECKTRMSTQAPICADGASATTSNSSETHT